MVLPSKRELESRIERLYAAVKGRDSDWDLLFLSDKINQYYFLGTMQDGVLVLTRGGDMLYFVRRSFERARAECPFTDAVRPMKSYRDVADAVKPNTRRLYLETETTTCAALARMGKYFDVSPQTVASADRLVQTVRAVKSPYELSCMEESGRQHKTLLEHTIPALLREGMSEAELCGKTYERMIALGFHGVARFGGFQTEMVVGQLGFGENSAYPTNFDGPGGMRGMSPAVPIVGDRDRRLAKGDLVFVDIGYGYNGYHSDRTQVYSFGAKPPEEAARLHNRCVQIQREIAGQLKPSGIPSGIYRSVTDALDAEFLTGFMGGGAERVRFLGHGVGLQIDEYPVIAEGFDEPLRENMALAVEPKFRIPGVGTVGVEDTYVVTPEGGRCITGGEQEIMVV
jgi:Xaa-Pro aminopeptidase